jgi:beta-aspartyl-dipeptidase (metallo-type)
VPVITATGSIQKDIVVIPKIIGVGEIAISDHRSSQPAVDDLAKIAAEARVGGILSGKGGIINLHLGDGDRCLDMVEKILQKTEIPITQFLPTHMNRNVKLFSKGIEFAKRGGFLDLTTSTHPKFLADGEVKASTGLKILLDAGINDGNITLTSDGQESLPQFDETGNLTGLTLGKSYSLWESICDAVFEEKLPLDKVLKTVTSNPADILKLKKKGYLTPGYDGDIVLLQKDDLSIWHVIAKGRTMVENGAPVQYGTFENKK